MRLPFWANLNTLAAIIIGALLVYIGLQRIELLTCKLHNSDLSGQIQGITDARNNQGPVTDKNIAAANVRIKEVQVVKERIIKAPNPSNCATPALEESRNAL